MVWFAAVPMYAMFLSSIYGIVALTFERYLAVVHPFWHKAHFRGWKVTAIFVFVWVFGSAYQLTTTIVTSGIDAEGICLTVAVFSSTATHRLYAACNLCISYLFPLACLVYFNFKMGAALKVIGVARGGQTADESTVRNAMTSTGRPQITAGNPKSTVAPEIETLTVGASSIITYEDPGNEITTEERHSSARISQFRAGTSGQTTTASGIITSGTMSVDRHAGVASETTLKARRNILKTLLIVGVGFLLCYTCNTFYLTFYQFGYQYVDLLGDFFKFTIAMTYLGCCINPIIYCIQYRQFQQAMRAVLCPRRPARAVHHGDGTGRMPRAAPPAKVTQLSEITQVKSATTGVVTA